MLTTDLPRLDRPRVLRPEPAPSPRQFFSPRVVVALLTLAGLGVRCAIVRGFWLDEATSGYDARQSYGTMLRLLDHDNHPPLHYTILWLVAHTLGSSETDLRLPSILFGTLLIPMLYLAGRALYDEWVGVVAAAFGTVGALAVWYAQEARMYALFMLLATVTIWAQARILQTGRSRYWVAWTLAAAAMVWTQWFTTLAIGTQVLIFLWSLRTRWGTPEGGRAVRRLIASVVSIAVLVAPAVPLLLTQFHNNQANGLGIGSNPGATSGAGAAGASIYGFFNNLVWALWGYHSTHVTAIAVAVWPLGLLAVLVLLGRGRTQANGILATQVLLPMAIVFLLSVNAAPGRSLFEIRYVIGAVPALYLLLAGAAWRMTPSVRSRTIFTGVILASLVAGTVMQQTDSANPRLYGYEAVFSQVSSIARPGDEILYAPAFFNVDVAYFAPHIEAVAATSTPPRLPADAQIFVVGSFPFAGSGGAQSTTGQLITALSRTRHLNEVLRAPNVTVWEFS